jgi:replicative DNA helicase
MEVPAVTDEYTPDPHDIAAEQSVLGAMLLSPAAIEKALAALTAADFYRPAHAAIFTACADLHRTAQAVDAVTVRAHLSDDRGATAPYLFQLIETCPAVTAVGHYAAIVRSHALRRRLIAAGHRITQWARADENTTGITERAIRELEHVRDTGETDDITTQTIAEFLAVPDEAHDWIVPGLLERGDRMILTGQEGAGKTTLFRQLGVTIAAGIHPFTGADIQPRKVLIIDCENGHAHTRRKLRPMADRAHRLGRPINPANLWLEIRPEGLDLALDRDVSWLLRRVAVIQPDVVMLGPLYRMVPRALNNDDDVAPILATFNLIRARGACVLVEAHAGHARADGGRRDLRPRGSSALLGWPEFGYGIRFSDDEAAKRSRLVDLVPWRGDRDERHWPEMLAGQTSEDTDAWPWTEYLPGYGRLAAVR